MTETISKKEHTCIVLDSPDSIREVLDGPPGGDEVFAQIETRRGNNELRYRLALLPFVFSNDFYPSEEDLAIIAPGWYLIEPSLIRLIEKSGAENKYLKHVVDSLAYKTISRVDYEDRRKGAFSILEPKEGNYGVLFIFDFLDD